MSAWPAPADAGSRYSEQRITGEDVPRLRLREVRLWGKAVWLHDESGRVLCDGCWRLVEVAKLGAVDNTHRVGLRNRAEGRAFEMRDDEPEPVRGLWQQEF